MPRKEPYSGELEWKLTPYWIRQFERPGSHTFGVASNPFPVFWLVLRGTRVLELDGNTIAVREGCIVYIPPGTLIRLPPSAEGAPLDYLSVGCKVHIGPLELQHVYQFQSVKQKEAASVETLQGLWMEALHHHRDALTLAKPEEFSPPSLSAFKPATLASLRLQGTLRLLYAELITQLLDQDIQSPVRIDQRIVSVCRYIHDHIHLPLTLEELASYVHLSPSHFSYLFREMLGQSPAKYLRSYRIGMAKDKLIHTSMTIKNISEQLGYPDQSQFSRAFRNEETISPLAYRNRWKNNASQL
jgi:AraC-like DNA-binding protein